MRYQKVKRSTVALLALLAACKSKPGDPHPPASDATASAAGLATSAPLVPSIASARIDSVGPVDASQAPVDASLPIVSKAPRDEVLGLCCRMFHPYTTGCVADAKRCIPGAEAYCLGAWKRGASMADVEPGLRKLVEKAHRQLPPQCVTK